MRFCIAPMIAILGFQICSATDSYDILINAIENLRNDEIFFAMQASEMEDALTLLKNRNVCDWNPEGKSTAMNRIVTTLQFYVCDRIEFPADDSLELKGQPCFFFDKNLIGGIKQYEDLFDPAIRQGAVNLRVAYLRIVARSNLDTLTKKDSSLLNLAVAMSCLDDLAATKNLNSLAANEYHGIVELLYEVEGDSTNAKNQELDQSTWEKQSAESKTSSSMYAFESYLTTLRYFSRFMPRFVATSWDNKASFLDSDAHALDIMLNDALVNVLHNISTFKDLKGSDKKAFAIAISRLAALTPREEASGAKPPVSQIDGHAPPTRAATLLDEAIFEGDISAVKSAASRFTQNKEALAILISGLERLSIKSVHNPESLSFISAPTIELCKTIRDALF